MTTHGHLARPSMANMLASPCECSEQTDEHKTKQMSYKRGSPSSGDNISFSVSQQRNRSSTREDTVVEGTSDGCYTAMLTRLRLLNIMLQPMVSDVPPEMSDTQAAFTHILLYGMLVLGSIGEMTWSIDEDTIAAATERFSCELYNSSISATLPRTRGGGVRANLELRAAVSSRGLAAHHVPNVHPLVISEDASAAHSGNPRASLRTTYNKPWSNAL